MCIYSPVEEHKLQRREVSVELIQLQKKVYNLGTRRKYFDAFLEGLYSPVFLFHERTTNSSMFDFPSTQPRLLQYHGMLASAIRSFGAPEGVYKEFEMQARQLAKELINDFSYHTALGYHIAAIHFWGSNQDLCAHYRDLTLSACKLALRKPKNEKDFAKIVSLYLLTVSVQDLMDVECLEFELQALEAELQTHSPDLTLKDFGDVVEQATNMAYFTCLSKKLFAKEENGMYYFAPITGDIMAQIMTRIGNVRHQMESGSSSVTSILVKGVSLSLIGLATYLQTRSEGMNFVEAAVALWCDNLSLLVLVGPRLVMILDGLFKVSIMAKQYHLAFRVANLQLHQAKYLQAAKEIAERNVAIFETESGCKFSIKTNEILKQSLLSPQGKVDSECTVTEIE